MLVAALHESACDVITVEASAADTPTSSEIRQPLRMRARQITESMAVLLQASLLIRHGPAMVANAFCASLLDDNRSWTYGTLPAGVAFDDIIQLGRVPA